VESVGFSGSLGVNLASTSNSGGPIGADHQRIFYQTYNRNSSITSATNTGSHLWRIWANGETNDLGAANPAFSLPSPPQVTGEILATSSPQACCPDATND